MGLALVALEGAVPNATFRTSVSGFFRVTEGTALTTGRIDQLFVLSLLLLINH